MTSRCTASRLTLLVTMVSKDCQSVGAPNGSRSVWRSEMALARLRSRSVTNSNGGNSIDARLLGVLGSGNRSICDCHPAAAIATRRWSSAAPQLMSASRADWSVSITRLGSRNNRSCPRLNTHCQGWLLCSDGARHAVRTTSSMTSVSTTVVGICRPPDLYLPPGFSETAGGSRAIGPRSRRHWASLVLLSATALGLVSCPVTDPLEIVETRDASTERVFGVSGFPQMLLRVGWAPVNAEPLPATPRRPLEDVVEYVDR